MTLMLASVTGPDEAQTALAGGADIIDLKDPSAGALGAVALDTVRETLVRIAGRRPVSAVTGDLPPDPQAVAAAVEAMAATGVDYVKVGLFSGPRLVETIRALAPTARRARLVGVLFADEAPDLALVDIIGETHFAGVMLDTAGKSGGRLLDHLGLTALAQFVTRAHRHGLLAGLAGSLEAPDVPRLLALDPDLLGFRGALCRARDRRGLLDADALAEIRALIPPRSRSDVTVLSDRSPLRTRGYGRDDVEGPLDRIHVRDLVLPVSIGAYKSEHDRQQRVRFDVIAELRRQARTSDDMRNVFSYDLIIDTIRLLAERGHVALVETLAENIAGEVLHHPQVVRVHVKVEKLDIGPGAVGVEIVRERARETATVRELFPTSLPPIDPKAAS